MNPSEVVHMPLSWEKFEGTGLPPSILRYQELLGSNSPVPFLSIDFLRGDTDVYLGEITPHPGAIINDATAEQDRIMGFLYEEAQARLSIDLLRGKQFLEYFSSYKVGLWE